MVHDCSSETRPGYAECARRPHRRLLTGSWQLKVL
jgi:hypothetical protein